ncbi:MAG: 1-deoxy-D-xylulose-5-phosphate reductoisomerase, partial [Candidatus Omnitrophota bacterium]
MKRVAILGSTGSIGINALKVISAFKDRFKVVGLSANSNVEVLDRQIRDFEPEIVCVSSLKDSTAFKGRTKVVSGAEGLSEVAAYPEADIVVVAITGSASLIPLLDAIRSGKQIALANKEALVSAGQIIMDEALKNNVNIVPVDSEHSAIFQCLDGRGTKD